jgi:hypothetical protein
MTPEELSHRLWQFAALIAKVVDALPGTAWLVGTPRCAVPTLPALSSRTDYVK